MVSTKYTSSVSAVVTIVERTYTAKPEETTKKNVARVSKRCDLFCAFATAERAIRRGPIGPKRLEQLTAFN